MEKYISDFDLSRFNLFQRQNADSASFYFVNNLPPLEEMFSGDNYYAILFKQWPGETIGHWVLLTKWSENHYEFFDCLGDLPPAQVISCLEEAGTNVRLDYTTRSLMGRDNTICGKWVMFRLLCLPNNLASFLDFFKKFKGNPDSVVNFVMNLPIGNSSA